MRIVIVLNFWSYPNAKGEFIFSVFISEGKFVSIHVMKAHGGEGGGGVYSSTYT
jgi:hypothetical protein